MSSILACCEHVRSAVGGVLTVGGWLVSSGGGTGLSSLACWSFSETAATLSSVLLLLLLLLPVALIGADCGGISRNWIFSEMAGVLGSVLLLSVTAVGADRVRYFRGGQHRWLW